MNRKLVVTLLSFVSGACAGESPAPQHPEAAASPPTTPAAAPTPKGPPQTCQAGTRPAADGLIDDFESNGTRPAALGGRDGAWSVSIADHATVTTPGKTFATSEGGPPGSKKAIHFAGKTANEDSWGAAVSVSFVPSGFYDASKYAGIAFKIKSATPNFNVRLKLPDVSSVPDGGQCKANCWNSFGKELIVYTEWQDVTLMWSDLSQQPDWGDVRPPSITPSKLKGADFSVYPGQQFDIWIDDIHLLECK